MQGFDVSKLTALLLYGMFGLKCLALAGSGPRETVPDLRRDANELNPGLIGAMLSAALLLGVYALRGSTLLVEAAVLAAIGCVLCLGPKASAKMIAAGASAGVLVLSLVWWQMRPTSGASLPLVEFALVLGLVWFVLSDQGRPGRRFIAVPVTGFLIAGLWLTADLGPIRSSHFALAILAHHWGAFLGPVLHVEAGLVPFYDVPLQYGLGPTLAIAAACDGTDCWGGAQAAFTFASAANGLLVLMMALAAGSQRGWLWQWGTTAVVFCAVFLWPGYPSEGTMFMAIPSAAGIRFFPVTLVACLLFFGRPRAAAVAMVPAVLWSPESAAMSVVVYGVVRTAQLGFLRATALTGGLLVASYGALFLIHRLVYGLWIDPLALVEYVLHVPGPLPIDPFSDILLLAATLILGGWLIYRRPLDSIDRQRDLVATMLLFVAASYCLGRSDPNNICNLAPYLVLVATRALDRPDPDFETMRTATAFGLAVSVAALAFSPWNSKPFAATPVFGIHDLVADFPSLQPDLEYIRKQIPPGLGIADFGLTKIRNATETVVWTPMDPSSLWPYVPRERRQVYIARSAGRLRHAGWAIFASDMLGLKDDLETAYTVSNQREVDGPARPGISTPHYTIACFTPKRSVVLDLVGPACPTR